MSNYPQNPSQSAFFSKDNTLVDFLSAIEQDFELSKEEFASVLNTIPISQVVNPTPYKLYKKKSSLLSVLRLW